MSGATVAAVAPRTRRRTAEARRKAFLTMVANHVEQNWWWSWAFVVQSGGIALVALTRAVAGGAAGGAAGAWWGLFVATALQALALVAGLAKTGTERSPV